jgi:microcystin-dependent protein
MFAGNFAPAGWMFCEGQLLPISENETLFQLIGTTYGGDGQSTFALPDLRGRIPIHMGNGFILAETGGAEEITLTVNQIPAHSHPQLANSGVAQSNNPQNNILAASLAGTIYNSLNTSPVNMNAQAIGPTGGSQPHTNFQPYLCIDFIISLFGIFPSPT